MSVRVRKSGKVKAMRYREKTHGESSDKGSRVCVCLEVVDPLAVKRLTALVLIRLVTASAPPSPPHQSVRNYLTINHLLAHCA
jgi:hypothetical protein